MMLSLLVMSHVPTTSLQAELVAGPRYTEVDRRPRSAFRTNRLRLGLSQKLGRSKLSVLLDRVDSSQGQSLFGVAGQSALLRIRRAELTYNFHPRLRLRSGLIESTYGLVVAGPWGLQSTLKLRESEPDLIHLADRGFALDWKLPHQKGALSLVLTNGEGFAEMEKDQGKDIIFSAVVRPMSKLQLLLEAQRGSRGAGSSRADRLTADLNLMDREGGVGLLANYGYGYQDDGSREHFTLSIRARRCMGRSQVAARGSAMRTDLSGQDDQELQVGMGLYRTLSDWVQIGVVAQKSDRTGDDGARRPYSDRWSVQAVLLYRGKVPVSCAR
ncbi:MAG: hypothetical protein VX834_08755 [Myxococcota bacterium]|nr:hypothetical protein [Myxococcota bacterium]